jgi:DNA-binding CsgD family transcriptional regulator
MADERFALLTDTQRTYLRLVHSGLTSKEIAQRLGGSHHTVNAEVAVAVRILGARGRTDAAAMLVAHDASASYEPSYDPGAIAVSPISEAPKTAGDRPAHTGFSLPIPTAGRPFNDLTFWQRTVWIVIIAAVVALLVGGLITGIIAQLDGLGRRM